MFPKLDAPAKLPRWATDSGRVLEPDEAVKDIGWQIDDVPPARWMNWIQNLQYQWNGKIMSNAIANWNRGTDISTIPAVVAMFHPLQGYWLVCSSAASSNCYRSATGNDYLAATDLSYGAQLGCACIDANYYIVGNSNQDLQASGNGGTSWSTITSATIGGSGALSYVESKYRPGVVASDNNYAMLLRGTPMQVRLAMTGTGVLGTWSAPTTPPPSLPAGATGRAIVHTGGNTWLVLTAGAAASDTTLYRTTNDGTTFTAATVPTFPTGSRGAAHMAWSDDTGRLVLVGSDDATNDDDFIAYSDDLGDTWTTATLDRKGHTPTTHNYTRRVFYAGGCSWVAISDTITSGTISSNRTIYYSTDDAETWQVADINTNMSATGTSIACDERRIIVYASSGINLHCNQI